MSNYFSIITNRGLAKLAEAKAKGTALKLTHIAVGDASGNDDAIPDSNQTTLINEVYRAEINTLSHSKTDNFVLTAELIIQSDIGGFIIREAGIFDSEGELFAVGRYPATVKPKLDDGIAREEVIQMLIAHANTDSIELKIDPSIVMASRSYVDLRLLDAIETRTIITVGNGGDYSNLQDAWDSIKGKRLLADLTIQLANGAHEYNHYLDFKHPPTGGAVRIVGNTNNPQSVELKVTQSIGTTFWWMHGIQNLELIGFTLDVQNYGSNAIRLANSQVKTECLTIKNAIYGIWAIDSSSLLARYTATTGCRVGILCESASSAHIEDSNFTYTKSELWSCGLSALNGSNIDIRNVTISGFRQGTSLTANASLIAREIKIDNCEDGVKAMHNSTIYFYSAEINNCDIAVTASTHSHCYAPDTKITNSKLGFYATENSYVRADRTSSIMENCQTPYSPPTSELVSNMNSLIYWN